MLGNLRSPPEPFADIVRTHFRLKARSLRTQLDQWLAEDDGKMTNTGEYQGSNKDCGAGTSSNGFAKDVADLKLELQKLQDSDS